RHAEDVGKALNGKSGEGERCCIRPSLLDHSTYRCGVEKDAGVPFLTHHFCKLMGENPHAEGPCQPVRIQGRTCSQPDWRELRGIAYEHQPAVIAVTDIFNQIFKKA